MSTLHFLYLRSLIFSANSNFDRTGPSCESSKSFVFRCLMLPMHALAVTSKPCLKSSASVPLASGPLLLGLHFPELSWKPPFPCHAYSTQWTVQVQQYLKWPFKKFGVSFLLSLNPTWLKWGTACVGENIRSRCRDRSWCYLAIFISLITCHVSIYMVEFCSSS